MLFKNNNNLIELLKNLPFYGCLTYFCIVLLSILSPILGIIPLDDGIGYILSIIVIAWSTAFIIAVIVGIVQSSKWKWFFIPFVFISGFLFHVIIYRSADLINMGWDPLWGAIVPAVTGMFLGEICKRVFNL